MSIQVGQFVCTCHRPSWAQVYRMWTEFYRVLPSFTEFLLMSSSTAAAAGRAQGRRRGRHRAAGADSKQTTGQRRPLKQSTSSLSLSTQHRQRQRWRCATSTILSADDDGCVDRGTRGTELSLSLLFFFRMVDVHVVGPFGRDAVSTAAGPFRPLPRPPPASRPAQDPARSGPPFPSRTLFAVPSLSLSLSLFLFFTCSLPFSLFSVRTRFRLAPIYTRLGFPAFLLGWTGFHLGLAFAWFLLSFHLVLMFVFVFGGIWMDFTWFYWVFFFVRLGFTEFTGFYRVLPGFTGVYLVLLFFS